MQKYRPFRRQSQKTMEFAWSYFNSVTSSTLLCPTIWTQACNGSVNSALSAQNMPPRFPLGPPLFSPTCNMAGIWESCGWFNWSATDLSKSPLKSSTNHLWDTPAWVNNKFPVCHAFKNNPEFSTKIPFAGINKR